MHYALTLYLIAATPAGTVLPARTAAVFDTLDACLAVAAAYQGQPTNIKFTCDKAGPLSPLEALTDIPEDLLRKVDALLKADATASQK